MAPKEGKVLVVVGDALADAKAVLLYVERAPMLANKVVAGLVVSDGRALGYKVDDGVMTFDPNAGDRSNIYTAKESDFRKASERVYRSGEMRSKVTVMVVR